MLHYTRFQRVRIAGKVDEIRYSDRAFTLILQSGEQIRGVLAEGEPEALTPFFGKLAVVDGVAQFRPSGSVLHLDAALLQPASEQDLALWSETPRPLFAPLDLRELMRPQRPTTGINAIIGAWPGDETDEEIFRMLEEMS
jgi:hypothetical protein